MDEAGTAVADAPKTGAKRKIIDIIADHKGQKAAVICARYQYRGIVSEVLEDGFVLANATAVETSGPTQSDSPDREDDIGSSVTISVGAIELFYQPKWCNAALPSE